MNDDQTPATPQPAGPGPDPLDDTQRVDIPRYAPAPDPRPDARWAWASPTGQPTSDRWYEAAPGEPAGATAPAWGTPASSPPPAYEVAPVAPVATRRSGPGVGTIVAASLLSAVIASGGTVIALDRAGAFDRPSPASNLGSANTTGGTQQQPVTIDESSAVIDVAAKLGPAVVKITTGAADPSPTDPFIPERGIGSGVIYDAAGWILTNRHVVADATTLTVELKDGRKFDGTVYGIDTLTDLAIVKIEGTDLPVAALGESDGLKIGQLVVAIGSPLGTYSFSVTSGIVSGKGRDVVVDNGSRINNLIQTDAAINPGNSGGPLADAGGNVVGINTAVATDSSGIGFAIPIDIAKPIMEQAVKGEDLSRPWIGIRFETINAQVKQDNNLGVDEGALVGNTGGTGPAIVEDSPAAKAGIQDGDVVLSISGIKLDQEHPLDAVLVQFAPGDTVELQVIRDGKEQTIEVTLGTRPGNL